MNIDIPKRIKEDEDLRINQQNLPLNNYNASVYKFPEGYFYTGYVYNASLYSSLNIQITLSTGENLPPVVIPPNAILKIRKLKIFVMNISSGYYTYSFLGSNVAGIPEIEIDPQNAFIYQLPYSTTGNTYTNYFAVNSTSEVTPGTLPDNVIVYALTVKADKNNTSWVGIFGNAYKEYYYVDPGESITLYMVNPHQLGFFTTANTNQIIYVMYNGSGAKPSSYHPLY